MESYEPLLDPCPSKKERLSAGGWIRFNMSNLNILTGGFFVLALLCRVDVVRAVFTPANVGDLKYAIGSCTLVTTTSPSTCTCSGGCLGENATGSCPTFAASNDATGNPHGMMGDWDVSNVTSLKESKSSPPVSF